jgi:putative peptidoglycan lipid II flippase
MIVGTQIAGVVETNVANTVAKSGFASVTVMATAWLIFMLPFSIVAVSIVTAYYTRMAEHARAGDMASFRFDFSTATRTISVLISFFSVAVIVAAYPISVVFTTTSYSQMGNVLIAYAIGMIPFCMLFVVQRAFYSLGDTRTPFVYTVIQTVIVVIGVIGCLFIAPEFRAMGIALTVSIGGIVQAVIAAVLLRRRMGRLDGRRIVRGLWRYLVAAIVAGAFGLAVLALLGGVSDGFAVSGKLAAIISIAAIGIVMLVVYAGMLRMLRTEELDVAIGALRGRISRRSGRSGGAE